MNAGGDMGILYSFDPARNGHINVDLCDSVASITAVLLQRSAECPGARFYMRTPSLNHFQVFKGPIHLNSLDRAGSRWKPISYARLPKALKVFMLINPEGA